MESSNYDLRSVFGVSCEISGGFNLLIEYTCPSCTEIRVVIEGGRATVDLNSNEIKYNFYNINQATNDLGDMVRQGRKSLQKVSP